MVKTRNTAQRSSLTGTVIPVNSPPQSPYRKGWCGREKSRRQAGLVDEDVRKSRQQIFPTTATLESMTSTCSTTKSSDQQQESPSTHLAIGGHPRSLPRGVLAYVGSSSSSNHQRSNPLGAF